MTYYELLSKYESDMFKVEKSKNWGLINQLAETYSNIALDALDALRENYPDIEDRLRSLYVKER